ncbi:MAG: YdeI/OmpD-associated family protein [Mobilitalea sp.]
MKQTFEAVITQHENMNAAYIEPPFSVPEVFGAKRVKVLATFDGVEYRGSLIFMGDRYCIGMTQEIRNTIGKTFGDKVLVTLEKDDAERVVEMPEDLQQAFNANPKAVKAYEQLSYTKKKEIVTGILQAKKEETRLSRITAAVNKLNGE